MEQSHLQRWFLSRWRSVKIWNWQTLAEGPAPPRGGGRDKHTQGSLFIQSVSPQRALPPSHSLSQHGSNASSTMRIKKTKNKPFWNYRQMIFAQTHPSVLILISPSLQRISLSNLDLNPPWTDDCSQTHFTHIPASLGVANPNQTMCQIWGKIPIAVQIEQIHVNPTHWLGSRPISKRF